ncbi:hypothetical protein BH23BAC1_BH23BAC1_35200 [soil metagenome]
MIIYKILCVLIVPIAISTSYAQNHFNLGISLGPAVSITSIKHNDQDYNIRPVLFSRLNYFLGINAQYLFENKFGLETGFNISTKNVGISTKNSSSKHFANMDSFSFPLPVSY